MYELCRYIYFVDMDIEDNIVDTITLMDYDDDYSTITRGYTIMINILESKSISDTYYGGKILLFHFNYFYHYYSIPSDRYLSIK